MWIIRWSSCSFSRKLPLRLIILDSFFAFTLVIVTPLCKTELSRKRNRWIRTSSAGKVIQVNLFHHVTGSCGLPFLNVAVRESELKLTAINYLHCSSTLHHFFLLRANLAFYMTCVAIPYLFLSNKFWCTILSPRILLEGLRDQCPHTRRETICGNRRNLTWRNQNRLCCKYILHLPLLLQERRSTSGNQFKFFRQREHTTFVGSRLPSSIEFISTRNLAAMVPSNSIDNIRNTLLGSPFLAMLLTKLEFKICSNILHVNNNLVHVKEVRYCSRRPLGHVERC